MGKSRASSRSEPESSGAKKADRLSRLSTSPAIKKPKKQRRKEKHDDFLEKVLERVERKAGLEETSSNKRPKKWKGKKGKRQGKDALRGSRRVLHVGEEDKALEDAQMGRGSREHGEADDEVKVKVVSSKQKTRLLEKEIEQVRSVLAHPAFKEDPIEAVRKHVLNTVCGADATGVPPAIAKKRKRRKKPGLNIDFQSGRQIKKGGDRKERLDKKMEDARKAKDIGKKESRGSIGIKRPKILD